MLEGSEHLFKYVNGAHIKVLGFDATGKTVRQAQPESVEVHSILDEVYLTGITANLNEISVTVGSVPRYFNVTFAANKDLAGEIDGILLLGIEVTEQVKSRETLKSAIENVRETVHARDEFLSIASHELKTPLTSLKLQSQMRLRKLQHGTLVCTPESLETMFKNDDRQINRITILIDDMLDISRINVGKLDLRPEKFELSLLINDVLERYANQIKDNGCEITLDLEKRLEGCWDRFRIEQVFTNLLTNALRYGRKKPIHISIQSKEGHAFIEVLDQGIGIAPENHRRIFERFERAIIASEISGLGLGLYIVKQIVEMHGGGIEVESSLGLGAKFAVRLPMSA